MMQHKARIEGLLIDSGFGIRLHAPVETVKYLLRATAEEMAVGSQERFQVEEVPHKAYGPCLSLRVRRGAIGFIMVQPLAQNIALLEIPRGRGAKEPARDFEADPDGNLFSQYLQQVLNRARERGLISDRSRFQSESVLDAAIRQLASADDSYAYASIGNVCRSAVIALANEIYQPHMLPSRRDEPKGDDADTKLKYAAHHYSAGHSKRQKEGLDKVITGVWDFAQVLTHRKNARKEDAELCVIMVTAVFDAFALIVPL